MTSVVRLSPLVRARRLGIVVRMFELTAKQQHWLEFLIAMTEKEIKARYKFAVLGFLWIVLNPLLQMIIVGGIFQFLIPVSTDHYFMYLFAGLLPWNFFSYTVTKNTSMILNERSLIKKANFPRESIILSVVLSNAFHLVVALLLFMLISVAVFGFVQLIKIPIIICALVLIILLTTGCSLLFSALNVKYRDVNFFVQALIPLWFYATPIVYTIDLVPSFLQKIIYLNPLTITVELMHYAFSGGEFAPLINFLPSIVVTMTVFIVGWWKFKKEDPNFEDWV